MSDIANIEGISGAGPVSGPALGIVCQALGGILSDGADIHRCQAAKALGQIGEPSAVQPLIKALLDEDEDVRTDAAEALLKLADPRAQEQLFENLLGDPCSEVKLAAIEALAKLQDQRVVPWLRRMVKGRDDEIAWDEEEFYASGWDDWVEVQIKAVSALAALKVVEAVPDIVEAVRDENAQDMSDTAFKALAQMDVAGIEALAEFLTDDNPRLRRRAAAALATINSKDVEAPLAQAFSDPSREVRLAVLKARAAIFPADKNVAQMMQDNDATVRAEAVRLVGKHHQEALVALLEDPAEVVRTATLFAIARVENIDADDGLIEVLCKQIDGSAGPSSIAAIDALVAAAPEVALDKLALQLGDTERPLAMRFAALSGLAAIGGEQAAEAIIPVMDDAARQIRLEAMSALANLARAEKIWPNLAATALLAALNGQYEPEPVKTADEHAIDASPAVEPEAEQAEPELDASEDDDNKAFPTSTIGSILEDVPEVARVAGFPDKGIELSSTDMERLAIARNVVGKKRVVVEPKVVVHDDIRRFAARVLGDVNHDDVVVELASALDSSDEETILAAADSLARIGVINRVLPADIAEVLMTKMPTTDRNLKLLLVRALAACSGADVVELLESQLSDEDSFVRTESIRALCRIGVVGTKVEALIGDQDPSVRMAAAEAVAAAGLPGAVDLLVLFAFSFEGHHGRPAARLLRKLDPAQASVAFVGVLDDLNQKRVWSVAIEALEELGSQKFDQGPRDMIA